MSPVLLSAMFRRDDYSDCTDATCPASESIYGYRPDLATNIIYLIIFAISGIFHAYQGAHKRTWFFGSAMAIGCLVEVLGYVGRLILNHDAFSQAGFDITVSLLTFAPAFFSAGIYYTLKHICLTFGASFSRLTPKYYTWIFITADIISIVLQGAGGGLASAGGSNGGPLLKIGENVMIAGLAMQVATLVLFGLLAADYAWAVHRNRDHLNPATATLRNSMRFKIFLGALVLSYTMILIRCVYRVAELSKGWSSDNNILHNQWLFVGLDGTTVAISTLVLNAYHPGWCFPKHEQEVVRASVSSASDASDIEAKPGLSSDDE